mmetsp:Transcript_58328/g.119297  ORF Transcript_58328/g.119297 Transcript_58328/m.119297 type:complete len:206 (-) Transcript_58328:149-766(-)
MAARAAQSFGMLSLSLTASSVGVSARTHSSLLPPSTAAATSSSLATIARGSKERESAAAMRDDAASCDMSTVMPSAPAAFASATCVTSVTVPERTMGRGPGKLPFAEACSLAKFSRSERPGGREQSTSSTAALFLLRVREKVRKSTPYSPSTASSSPRENSVATMRAPEFFLSALNTLVDALGAFFPPSIFSTNFCTSDSSTMLN